MTGSAAISLYIVAEDDSVRHALADLPAGRTYDIRSFDSPITFLAAVPEPRGILLVGLRLRGMNGLALQSRLAGRPLLKLIFVSATVTIPAAVAAMKGGAIDFLVAPVRSHQLIDTVAQATDQLMAMRDRTSGGAILDRSLATLTTTEREIATLMARGLRNRHIAQLTRKAENTVKVHRARIMRKLGADHNYHLRAIMRRVGEAAEAAD